MAVAYQSHQNTAFASVASAGALVITKPTGLQVGDHMTVHLSAITSTGNLGNWDTPSGWTSLINVTNTGNLNSKARLTVFYKVADSGDAAATNFSFILNTNPSFCGGTLFRANGGAFVTGASGTGQDTTSPSFTNTLTPSANSLLLFLATISDASQTTGSASGYAIATDNPSWTERADFSGNDGIGNPRGMMASATAVRVQSTATGNSTITFVNYAQNSIGAMVAISPILDAAATPATLVATLSIPAPDGSGGAVATPATLVGTYSLPAPTPSTPSKMWVNKNKS